MNLKTAFIITQTCGVATLLFLALWLLFDVPALLFLCIGIIGVTLLFEAVFCRCPHCGHYLRSMRGKYCPYCGKDLGL